MESYELKPISGKGLGAFSLRDIAQGERLFQVDLRLFTAYSPEELEIEVVKHPELNGDHANYLGHGKYVIEETPAAYMNHACDPNCYFKMHSIAVYDVIAFRDIAQGEELTHDYAATSVDQFAGQGFWTLECRCGSPDCRGLVTGDFFQLPLELQKRHYPHLPPSTKRKYRKLFAWKR
jgi:hypothetical protein